LERSDFKNMSQTFVLSVGGSLIVDQQGINYEWLKKFCLLVRQGIKNGHRFYLVAGGGVTARQYIQAASKIIKASQDDKDWVGIEATRLNALLLRVILGGLADPAIIIDPTKKIKSDYKIRIAAGYKPGRSTDYVAVALAKRLGVKRVINLSNIDYAYNKDPRRFKDAQPLLNVSWPEFRRVVGDVWQPGANAPFDPIASRLAEENKLSVAILHGGNLTNLRKCLSGRAFIGTSIK
jgi:uridylate kinase